MGRIPRTSELALAMLGFSERKSLIPRDKTGPGKTGHLAWLVHYGSYAGVVGWYHIPVTSRSLNSMANGSPGPATLSPLWSPIQVIILSAVCLLIGLVVGYLVRGSAPTATAPRVAATETAAPAPEVPARVPGGMGSHPTPTLDDMKRMADEKAEPLLAKLKTDPNNAQTLNQLGIIYEATHQFKEAEGYFEKSLKVDPKNVDVRTDLASCLYYNGDVDGALAQLQKALSYDPKHAGALMNIGIIKWQGKKDVSGAVAAWEKLLKLNPNFPQKDVIEHLITEAKQQQSTAQSSNQPKG